MMKIAKFMAYGALIGVFFAVIGSMMFSLISLAALSLMLHTNITLWVVGIASLLLSAFTVIPGALGGMYLAFWLGQSERTVAEITRRGLFVGAVAGMLASFAFMAIVFRFLMDWMTFGFAILAMAIASTTSLVAARWLAKKKGRFVQPEMKEPGHAEYVQPRKESEELK